MLTYSLLFWFCLKMSPCINTSSNRFEQPIFQPKIGQQTPNCLPCNLSFLSNSTHTQASPWRHMHSHDRKHVNTSQTKSNAHRSASQPKPEIFVNNSTDKRKLLRFTLAKFPLRLRRERNRLVRTKTCPLVLRRERPTLTTPITAQET